MHPSNRPLVIVNPASRGGDGARDWPSAAAALAAHFGPFERRFTEHPGHAATLAEEAAGRGKPLLVTFGGDGTISEVARGILASGRPCELAVLPHGTGGDFIRSLQMPRRLADAARALSNGTTRALDVGRATLADGVSRPFINSASFGLSSAIARRVNRSDKSKAAYARHTAASALGYHFPEVLLEVDGAPVRRLRITTVSLHNGRFFGGGMKMAPAADLADGRLQLVVVRKMPVWRLLSRAPLMYWGAHLDAPEVEQGTLERLTARAAEGAVDLPVEVDGETPGCLPASFGIETEALRVRVPREH